MGTCIPDAIWSYADIDDILGGTFLRSLLMNAKGLQKILLASAVANPVVESEFEGQPNKIIRKIHNLAAGQLSDYEEVSDPNDSISGKIVIGNSLYYLNGFIGYDEEGNLNSYKGTLEKLKSDDNSKREFSSNLRQKILNILNSPYRKVKPGEQTTSTFHKIILDDPNEWYQLEKARLFEEALYTFLYFKRVSSPPSLYDENVVWFGSECINLFVYHFARLALNNRIYDKFNNIEVTQLKIAYGEYIPKSLIYTSQLGASEEYPISGRDNRGIFETLLTIGSRHSIFTPRETDLLTSLYIRAKPGVIPKVENRHK